MGDRPKSHKALRVNNPRYHRRKTPVERADRGYGLADKAWRGLRAAILRAEPLCRSCATLGATTPARHIDHVDEDANNNDPANLQPLCVPCHSRKTIAAGKGWGKSRPKGRPVIKAIPSGISNGASSSPRYTRTT